jgi:hypothetical protein
MTFPKPVLDPKSMEPMPRYRHFSCASRAKSRFLEKSRKFVKKRHPSGNIWPEFRSFGGGCCLLDDHEGFGQHWITYLSPNSIRNIGRPQRLSIEHGCWRQLSIRQKTSSHILSRQCASRWPWGIQVFFFLVGSILMRCGKLVLVRESWNSEEKISLDLKR